MGRRSRSAWLGCALAALALGGARAAEPEAAPAASRAPASAAPAAPMPAPADPTAGLTIDRLEWSGAPAGAKVVVVENDYGDVRVRGTEGDDVVEVHTVVQRLDSAGEKLALGVERVGSAISIRVAYPPASPADPDARARRARLDRADIVVFVPEDVSLELRTRKGIVDVTEFEGEDVEAETEAGAIRVVAEKSVRARSISGPIHVLVREPDGSKPMWLESASGSIEAELPPEVDLDVRARTGGKIVLGYPADVESKNGVSRASLRLGHGDRMLVVQSQSGDVRIAPAPAWKPVPGRESEREREREREAERERKAR